MLVRPTLLPIDHWTQPDTGFATMRVTSPYGDRPGGFHAAIDIGNARLGDVLTAAASGTVLATGYLSYPWSEPKPSDAQWQSWGSDMTRKPSLWEGPTWGGQMVVIKTRDYFLLYAHCRTITVRTGQQVRAFDQIGTVGESGSAYRAGHLHFGVVVATDELITELRNRRTAIPRVLTRDPWPLIAPTVQLPDTAVPREEEDMSAFGTGTINAFVNLRSGPGTQYPTNFQTTSTTDVDLLAYEDKGGEYVAGGKTRTDWLKVSRTEEHWCAAAFVANRKSSLFPSAGYTAEDLKEAQIIARQGAADKAEAQMQAWVATRPPIRP